MGLLRALEGHIPACNARQLATSLWALGALRCASLVRPATLAAYDRGEEERKSPSRKEITRGKYGRCHSGSLRRAAVRSGGSPRAPFQGPTHPSIHPIAHDPAPCPPPPASSAPQAGGVQRARRAAGNVRPGPPGCAPRGRPAGSAVPLGGGAAGSAQDGRHRGEPACLFSLRVIFFLCCSAPLRLPGSAAVRHRSLLGWLVMLRTAAMALSQHGCACLPACLPPCLPACRHIS